MQHVLQDHIPWHKARLAFCASFLVALIKTRTVNLTEVALALNPKAKASSNYRRIQRFLAAFSLDFDLVAPLILSLIPQKRDLLITLDRTNWRFGHCEINILMIGVAYRGLAFPVLWKLLGKAGNSNTDERIALTRRLLRLLDPGHIKALVADREFIGARWLGFLIEHDICFVIRIRENARIGRHGAAKAARTVFGGLQVGQVQRLGKKCWVYGHRLFVVGLRLDQQRDSLLVLITGERPRRALALYGQRWQIETLFAALKSRGFNFEETHLSAAERLEKLIALLSIAFAWAYLVGHWLDTQVKPIKIKRHGRRARSVFRYGLDHLREILLNIEAKWQAFCQTLLVLSCT